MYLFEFIKYVTTHNFRSFFQTSTIYYSQVTIHHLLFTDHYSSFYYSSFSESVCDSEKCYYSYDTIHPGRKILFTIIFHHHVNLVYGYSNSSNRLGLAANSCIIHLEHFIWTRISLHILGNFINTVYLAQICINSTYVCLNV